MRAVTSIIRIDSPHVFIINLRFVHSAFLLYRIDRIDQIILKP